MTFHRFTRRAVMLALATVVGLAGAGVSQLTPTASALPPVTCSDVESRLSSVQNEIAELEGLMRHLWHGGVTSDEVAYVSATTERLSALYDELFFLRSIMYQCLKKRFPGLKLQLPVTQPRR